MASQSDDVVQPLADIRSLISRHTPPDQIAKPLNGVRLIVRTAPGAPTCAVNEPSFALVAQGRKRTVLGDKVFESGTGDYVVVPVILPLAGHVLQASPQTPYLAFVLALNPSAIATLMLQTATGGRRHAQRASMAISKASTDLLDPIARFLRLLDHRDDISVLQPLIEREILFRLLASEHGGTMRQIGLADSRLSQMSRVIRHIRDHYADTLRNEDLARMAAMSAASFHRHFLAATGMSPLRFQKQIRLHEARSRLIANTQGVKAVGFEVGYDSPSQFSREYSRFFGMPPSEDMKRLRTNPPVS
jgi:AraC-like DNA-binding protein